MFGVINIQVLNDILGGKNKTPFKQSRLDFMLVIEDFLYYPCNTSIETGYRTDHSCPTLVIKLLDITRGRGFWKFTNSLLYDHNYISMVKEIIKEYVKQYATTSIPSNFVVVVVVVVVVLLFFKYLNSLLPQSIGNVKGWGALNHCLTIL